MKMARTRVERPTSTQIVLKIALDHTPLGSPGERWEMAQL